MINPQLRPNNPRLWFPIGLSYIATAAENAGYSVTIYDIDAHHHTDQEFEAYLNKNKFDVVAFGCLVTHYKWVKWALSVIRTTQPHAKIILGNTIASSIPNQILMNTEADVAVIGEGEVTFVEVLRAIENGEPLESVAGIHFKADGKIKATPPRPVIKNIDTIPFPNRELFDMETYLNKTHTTVGEPYPLPIEELVATNISTARGCVFNCTFCYHGFQGTGHRFRSAKSVAAEITEVRNKYGVNYVHFFDDLSFSARGMLENFCDQLIEDGIEIFWTAAILATLFGKPGDHDAEIVRKVKQTGCVAVGYSIESANADILEAMNKHITLEGFTNTRKTLLAGGVASLSSVVFGYPQETPETIENTIQFCIGLGLAPSAGYLLPLPGTPMHEYAKKVGIIKDEEDYLFSLGDRQDLHVNLTQMSDEELINRVTEGITRCQKTVLGEDVSFDHPLKTGSYRSRDDSNSSEISDRLESGSAYTVFDHYKTDGAVDSVESPSVSN